MMSDKLRAAAKAFMEMQNINPSCADFYHETKELHKFSEPCKPLEKYMKVVDALRAALAEPAIKEFLTAAELRPVGQLQESVYGRGGVLWFNKPADTSMLYTAPPRKEWVSLTDDEVNLIYAEPQTHVGQYAKAIETKLREKNT